MSGQNSAAATKTSPPEQVRWIDVVDRLLQVTGALHGRLAEVAAVHDLTPQQMMLIRSLDEPTSMSEIATERSCDPSNVTGLIDRLEKRGLVARSPDQNDRRVKLLSLTEAGRAVRKKLDRDIAVATEGFGLRDDAARRQLNDLLLQMHT